LTAASGPNIIFIVADDLGWGDLGGVNGGLSQTPALDALVAEGTCLAQHHSASPVCAPARAALLTGRYPHRTGAIDTLESRGLDRIHLGEATLADALHGAGYVTGMVGKWHNGALDARYHPTARGFDEFVGFSGGWSDYRDWRLDVGGTERKADGRYLTDVFTDEAIAFVTRHRHEPFLLLLTYNAPHYPLQAPDADLEPFRGDDRLSDGVRLVYAMVRAMDRGIGRVVDALDDLGLADDTMVVFTSDNGPQLLGVPDHDVMRTTCGLRGMKGLVYDGGIRLPAVVRWPARLAPSRVSDDAAHLTDWVPTLLDITGAVWPGLPLDGVSLLPVLDGNPAEADPVRCWQWNRYTPTIASNAAVRDGRWKLVVPPAWSTLFPLAADSEADHDIKDHPERWTAVDSSPLPVHDVAAEPAQLFDIEADPGEEHDLAAAHPDLVARLHAELERWFADVDGERRALRWD
jgi:arylsulfatase A-like enzyme